MLRMRFVLCGIWEMPFSFFLILSLSKDARCTRRQGSSVMCPPQPFIDSDRSPAVYCTRWAACGQMNGDPGSEVYSDPLAQWFVTDAYRITDTAELVKASGEKLVEAGIPLYRLAYFQTALHPELAGKRY